MRNWINLFETTRPDDRWTANEILLRAGYEMLGSGSFATVYEKPGSAYVLKLFDSDDLAYIAFINLVKQHPNPHFPKLIGKPIAVSRGFSAIRMEKLGRYRGDPDLFEVYVTCRDRDVDPHGYMGQRMGDVDELFYEYPTLKTALDLMIDNLTPAFHFDIAQRNLMVRGSTIVFTDPVKNVPNGQERAIIPVPFKAPPPPKTDAPMSKKMAQMLDDDDLLAELLGEASAHPASQAWNKLWFNVHSKEVIPCPRAHGDEVENDPERFGVDEETVERLQAEYPEDGGTCSWWEYVRYQAQLNGWVRIGVVTDVQNPYIYAATKTMAVSALRWMAQKGYVTDKCDIEISDANEPADGEQGDFYELEGKLLAAVLRNGAASLR
jgi:hypothetical protein